MKEPTVKRKIIGQERDSAGMLWNIILEDGYVITERTDLIPIDRHENATRTVKKTV